MTCGGGQSRNGSEQTEAKDTPLPEPLNPLDRPPLDRYCDLVLKGGVVDGVIYPGVLIELARAYRFQSLAGTSVGAIAAALAAACEYARRFGSDSGFNEVLRTLPEELGKRPAAGLHATVLRSLFQTTRHLQRLFDVAVDAASVKRENFVCELVQSLCCRYRWPLVIGFLAGVLLWWWLTVLPHGVPIDALFRSGWPVVLTWIGALGAGLVSATISVAWSVYRDVRKLAREPGFGFCSGRSTDGDKTEGLTDWLHRGIQGAAGLSTGRPLTFRDLWLAPGGPSESDGTRSPKSIDLRMMTTCVSHGRPYELPLQDQSVRLFFRPSELSRYFPKSIITHLVSNCKPYGVADMEFYIGRTVDDETSDLCAPKEKLPDMAVSPYPEPDPPPGSPNPTGAGDPCKDARLYELPRGDLPVLVAVRLSMNFPLLFQAVPLWAIDHEYGRLPTRRMYEAPRFKRAWFADGGVTSNFPLHVFDNPLPRWPTFGIYIAEKSRKKKSDPGEPDVPFAITTFHTSGRSEKWIEIGEAGNSGTGGDRRATGVGARLCGLVTTVKGWTDKSISKHGTGFGAYLWGLVAAAKDWADNANLRMPGVRDRVVIVYKNGQTNGGLNLNLTEKQIRSLAYANGTKAGHALAKKFLPGGPKNNHALDGSAAWLDHRWVRFNSHLSALKRHIEGFGQAIAPGNGTSSLGDQIAQATLVPALYREKLFEPTLSQDQANALQDAVKALQQLEVSLTKIAVRQPYVAKPQFELKARSPL